MGSSLSCMTGACNTYNIQSPVDTDSSHPPCFSSFSCILYEFESATERVNRQRSSRIAPFKTKRPVDIDMTLVMTRYPPDFLIIVAEEKILVHGNLLEETCPYFQCMFECGIQEVEKQTLEVKNTKASVVRTVIAYLYGEDISISWEDVTDYIDIAEMWQLIELKDELEDYIVTSIDAHRNQCAYMRWVDIAEKYRMQKLERKILNLATCIKLCLCLGSLMA